LFEFTDAGSELVAFGYRFIALNNHLLKPSLVLIDAYRRARLLAIPAVKIAWPPTQSGCKRRGLRIGRIQVNRNLENPGHLRDAVNLVPLGLGNLFARPIARRLGVSIGAEV
jgi:hypothetical protein